MLNDDQRDYMRQLSAKPRADLCPCGWYMEAECSKVCFTGTRHCAPSLVQRIRDIYKQIDCDNARRAAEAEGMQQAWQDVIAERRRQVEAEGWTPEHDDEHASGEMARAAVCYADPLNEERAMPPAKWPWDAEWWKPKDRRRDLVRAAALILAEIERLDRLNRESAALSQDTGGDDG